MILQCCKFSNLITIYDIDSDQEMDKFILYALLQGMRVILSDPMVKYTL